MFLTITPNPCIERTAQLPRFNVGESYRVPTSELFVNAGGKGFNAARVAAAFGTEVVALGWAGRRQRAWMESLLDGEGVTHHLVETETDTRVAYNIVAAGRNTEIVEAGNPLAIADGTRLLEAFSGHLRDAELIALCGSYPPSDDPAFRMHGALLCRMAADAGKRMIYDGKGPAFETAVRSKNPPWMIKPNLDEAAALLHRNIEGPAEERRAVKDLRRLGVEIVVLSCGERGAYVGYPGGVDFFEAPEVETISAVGSGDSLVGALAAVWLATGNLLEAVVQGVAAGAANAAQLKSGFVRPDDVAGLIPRVIRRREEISLLT